MFVSERPLTLEEVRTTNGQGACWRSGPGIGDARYGKVKVTKEGTDAGTTCAVRPRA